MSLFDAMLNRAPQTERNYTKRIGDWSTSVPHLSLLSQFVNPQELAPLSDEWKEALGEPPQDAIERYVKLGLLVSAATAQGDGLVCSPEACELVQRFFAKQKESDG